MSYFQIETGGGPSDEGIRTITGDDAVAVSGDASFNINLLGDEDSGVRIDSGPGANTLTVYFSNFVKDTTTTVDAATDNVLSLPLGAIPGVYTVDVKITGYTAAGVGAPLGTGYAIVGAVRTNGTTAILTGSQAIDHFEEGVLIAGDAILSVSGNNLNVAVTGTLGYTINWTATLEYLFGT